MDKVDISIIIPTLNGEGTIGLLLDRIKSQVCPWTWEVIVIDSESTDNTTEIAERTGTRLLRIERKEFGHGKTRNYGAENAVGEYLVFVTQDAIPVDQYWLYELVCAASMHENIAGAFSRHIANDNASIITRKSIQNHFDNIANECRVVNLGDRERYESDAIYRGFLHFYSDNSSCMKKSVWEKIPYPDVDFAEDQLWAKAILEAGYYKSFADKSVVMHSHDYTPFDLFRRKFDESMAFKKYFGYHNGARVLDALGGAFSGAAAYSRFYKEVGGMRYALRMWPRSLAISAAESCGVYLGKHWDKLPRHLVSVISKDKSLNKKGR